MAPLTCRTVSRRAVERWAQLAPKDETPYREWGNALLARRDRAGARSAYMAGRQQLGPTALAPELAQLAVLESDFPVRPGSGCSWP